MSKSASGPVWPKRGHYGRWSEDDLIMAVATYKNGDKGLNECRRIYKVPKATVKRYADEIVSAANEVKAKKRMKLQDGFSTLVKSVQKKYMTKACEESVIESHTNSFGAKRDETHGKAVTVAIVERIPGICPLNGYYFATFNILHLIGESSSDDEIDANNFVADYILN
ncbi:hypothetical protein HNY73_015675 [Argiope bruennichi]|uniref:HTH psq-type domain-containing protein n=1 Tax=Argiope bruennichi TaxID=94029 RepID=A0A8T0EGR4_ARGBR|nr:hypothetical protein HNY73_015675 [Argiope bruennichi]